MKKTSYQPKTRLCAFVIRKTLCINLVSIFDRPRLIKWSWNLEVVQSVHSTDWRQSFRKIQRLCFYYYLLGSKYISHNPCKRKFTALSNSITLCLICFIFTGKKLSRKFLKGASIDLVRDKVYMTEFSLFAYEIFMLLSYENRKKLSLSSFLHAFEAKKV